MVFFDAIDGRGKDHTSGYVLQNGKVVGDTCSKMKVRPIGSPYPAKLSHPTATGHTINMTLKDGTEITAVVEKTRTQVGVPFYSRWTGNIKAKVGGKQQNGVALWEEFRNRIT